MRGALGICRQGHSGGAIVVPSGIFAGDARYAEKKSKGAIFEPLKFHAGEARAIRPTFQRCVFRALGIYRRGGARNSSAWKRCMLAHSKGTFLEVRSRTWEYNATRNGIQDGMTLGIGF